MKILRTASCVVSAMVLGSALALGVATPAAAQQDLDCSDFSTQNDAQVTLNAVSGDPNNLDADSDGRACEDLEPVVNDMDCADYATQQEAQAALDRQEGRDFFGLDADNDGTACEGIDGPRPAEGVDDDAEDEVPEGAVAAGGGGTAGMPMNMLLIALGATFLVAAGAIQLLSKKMRRS